MNLSRIFCAAICALGATTACRADLITFTVDVTQATVNVGGTVDWQLFVTVSDAGADNFGIDTASANLADSFGETLTPATVGDSGDPFEFYSFKYAGSFDVPTKVLKEVGANLFTQNALAEADIFAGDSPGPLLLASGSYTASTLGTHTLSATAGSTNTYFTAAGQINGNGLPFDTAFVNDTFEVQAVPEPSQISFGILFANLFWFRDLAKAAPIARPLLIDPLAAQVKPASYTFRRWISLEPKGFNVADTKTGVVQRLSR